MKKLFALLLSIVLVLSTISIPAYAEIESSTRNDVVFDVEKIMAEPGTDVSVAFTVAGEYEAHALTVAVSYDANMLSVVDSGLTQGDIWQSMIDNEGVIVSDATIRPGQISFMSIMPTNSFSGSGTIFTMNFHVNESVESGITIPLELEVSEFNYMSVEQTAPTPIPFTANNGSITTQAQHSDVVFGIENITATPGTDVSVAFTVAGEYEAHALTVAVNYDESMLSVTDSGLTQGDIWQSMISNGGMVVADATTRPGQTVFMAIMPTESFSGSGTVFTINFHVDESVEPGTIIPLELDIREFYYMSVEQDVPMDIPFTANNGSITTQAYHTVTFVDWDGAVLSTQNVAHGTAAVEPTAPGREGYTFTGWDTDFSNVQSDLTVTAQYAINSYTITYTINGEEYTTQTYEYGATVVAPEFIVPEGHTFSSWKIPETMPAENLILDAVLTVNEYTITYKINGEVYTTQTYEYGAEVSAPSYEVPAHFIFSGWNTPETMPAEDLELNATLIEEGKYTVTFVVDGEPYFTFIGYEGDVIVIPEVPEKLGHTFVAWDGMPESGILPAANITVTAVWSVNTYTITYTINGEEYITQTYEYGVAVSAPEYTVPEGYTFSGWNVPATMPAENLVIDAVSTINVYEVTLIDGVTGETIAVLHVEHGQDAVLPDAPDHTGYIFDHWEGNAANVTENRTITALYWMIGDTNHDGEITASDALLIMRYALGLETEGNELVMDFNGDGRVDSIDALLVLRRSMGIA